MPGITLGRYIWERIHQLGVDTIFGVPGDFNLQFLDPIYEVEGLKWVGNMNELNAAYAADGYAKMKGVPGVIVTTHGVGELSALNGVAGAMSEHVKMIHIVGQTTRAMQEKHLMIHHSIGYRPDHQQYNHATRGLRVAAAELWDIETAPGEIDRVIRECFIQSGPVYIFLPLDLSAEEVSVDLLKTPIDLAPNIDNAAQKNAVSAVKAALDVAKHPVLLIDALAQRFNAVSESQDLVSKLNIPFFSTNMAKGVIDETHEMYVGVWNGVVGHPGVASAAEASDLVITLGYMPADTNSGGFTRKLDEKKSVHINPFDVNVKGQAYSNTYIRPLLAALVESLGTMPKHNLPRPLLPAPREPLDEAATHITQSWLYPQLERFLKPGDAVLAETGTAVFGMCDIKFPSSTRFVTQIYYGSIGWATAATLGVALAQSEISDSQEGRTILVTGDGSMAMTIQELGVMIKAGIKPIIFVLNNDGYTVERMIWGAKQAYNDMPAPTDFSHLLPLFKHPSPKNSYHLAKSKSQFEAILASPGLQNPDSVQLVEILVGKMDSAWRLQGQLASRGKETRERLEKEGFVNTYGDWGLSALSDGDVKWS